MTKLQKWWIKRNHIRFRLLGLKNLFQETKHKYLTLAEKTSFGIIQNHIDYLNDHWKEGSNNFKAMHKNWDTLNLL